VNKRLSELLQPRTPQLLWDSMAYSVYAGGKRLRPVLNILAAQLKGDQPGQTLDVACAIELIHTYSLIHDDLPALDNDTLRRGAPTNHMVFGEAQAILAGDGLLNYAYEVMLNNAARYPENLPAHMRAIALVAKAAGVGGMIAGQVFQILDDVLDVTAGAELGKTVGKDAKSGKTTYPTLFGIEESLRIAHEKTQEALEALSLFGERGEQLRLIASEMLERKK